MPRKRNPENIGLPNRWRKTRGAYYYQVPPGLEHAWDGKKTFKLGNSIAEAGRVWAERVGTDDKTNTIAQLIEKYSTHVIPQKASANTRTGDMRKVPRLKAVFGDMPLTALEPHHIYTYVHKSASAARARQDIKLLSHAFTKAVEWGLVKRHPFKNEVRFKNESPRNRYVEDWEISEIFSLDSRRKNGSVKMIQAYLRIKLLTGMSQRDLLLLKPAVNFKDDGIHIQRSKVSNKTGKQTIYTWTTELRSAVQAAIEARPVDIAPWLFCTRAGKGYVNEQTGEASSWATIWQRFMSRVLEETKITERFTEHDLRAKVGSDADSLEHARALLSHADSRITNRVYRRKPEVVTPLRNAKLNSTTQSE